MTDENKKPNLEEEFTPVDPDNPNDKHVNHDNLTDQEEEINDQTESEFLYVTTRIPLEIVHNIAESNNYNLKKTVEDLIRAAIPSIESTLIETLPKYTQFEDEN